MTTEMFKESLLDYAKEFGQYLKGPIDYFIRTVLRCDIEVTGIKAEDLIRLCQETERDYRFSLKLLHTDNEYRTFLLLRYICMDEEPHMQVRKEYYDKL